MVASKRTYLAAEERREQILDVAKQLFARESSVSVGAICTAAGISRATLYHYFASAQHVRLALIDSLRKRVERAVRERPRATGISADTPLELIDVAVRQYLRAVVSMAFEERAWLSAALRARNTDQRADAILGEIEDTLIAGLQEDLEAAAAAGVIQVRDHRMTARYLFHGLAALVTRALVHDEATSVDALVDTATDIQLRGILKETGRDERPAAH